MPSHLLFIYDSEHVSEYAAALEYQQKYRLNYDKASVVNGEWRDFAMLHRAPNLLADDEQMIIMMLPRAS